MSYSVESVGGDTTGRSSNMDSYPGPFNVQVSAIERPKYGQDVILNNPNAGLFGVFDGMGSGYNPALAASTAAKAISEFYDGVTLPMMPESAAQQMLDAIKYARREVVTRAGNNATTAAIVRLQHFEKGLAAIWGNSGDSRIFVRSANGEIDYDVCTDQSRGNILENGLGAPTNTWPRMDDESGYKFLNSGDRIMICSDGITGDWPDEKISERDFVEAFNAEDAGRIAQKFIDLSRKSDDKSIVVIEIL